MKSKKAERDGSNRGIVTVGSRVMADLPFPSMFPLVLASLWSRTAHSPLKKAVRGELMSVVVEGGAVASTTGIIIDSLGTLHLLIY